MNRQVIVFVGIIAAALALFAAMWVAKIPLVFFIVGILFLVVVASLFPELVELKEYERAVVFRIGKYNRVGGPGWILIFPLIERFIVVDMRTQAIDTPPQAMITRDDVRVKVDAVLYIRVVDPKKAIIEIKDYKNAVVELLRSNIRNAVAKMDLEELLEKTEELDSDLHAIIAAAAQDWGIATHRVEVQSIELPPELVEAMRKRKEAVEYKARAETEAAARQISLDILDKAASKMSDRTLAYLYLDSLKKISEGKSNKIIFPLELSHLASMLSGKLTEKQVKGEITAKPDYSEIINSLVEAYKEKKRDIIEESVEKKQEAKKEEKPAGEQKKLPP
ncbi:SPFH domain-containing protein [Candidatus Micrarchaeota archaeon]|nr:SPFH domain-containing protein [Candidatus Micrarchaeota archaeon]